GLIAVGHEWVVIECSRGGPRALVVTGAAVQEIAIRDAEGQALIEGQLSACRRSVAPEELLAREDVRKDRAVRGDPANAPTSARRELPSGRTSPLPPHQPLGYGVHYPGTGGVRRL